MLNVCGGLAGSLVTFVLPGAFYVAKMPRSAPLFYPCLVMMLGGLTLAILVPYSVISNTNTGA